MVRVRRPRVRPAVAAESSGADVVSAPEPLPSTGLARCYRHPMRETGVRCIRCDRPICPECMRPASVGFHCPDDVNLAARSVRAPRTVVGAPVRDRPLVTGSLIGVNVAVYLVTALGSRGGFNSPQSSELFGQWVLIPFSVAHGHEFLRLITSAFLHLSVTHIVLNMIALGFVGPFLERALGWWRFLAVYLIAALGGSVLVYLAPGHFTRVAGASGAIYGLFAASLILAKRMNLDLRAFATVVVINFVFTFSIPGISIEGHIGGFLAGGAAALVIVGIPQWRHVGTSSRAVPINRQLAGLAAIVVVLLIIIVIRTATFPLGSSG